ncbi:hypothetical protein H5410_011011 [Solanum commersonii]|uniref:Uncharacterized protein n=1 Tax=Solanum commersonii TaxID=4109 RepID=A0A9J6AN53_SOLCO|nr:hypothetical protein H5410_011011 [Solanum commersonii]
MSSKTNGDTTWPYDLIIISQTALNINYKLEAQNDLKRRWEKANKSETQQLDYFGPRNSWQNFLTIFVQVLYTYFSISSRCVQVQCIADPTSEKGSLFRA